MRVLGRIAKVLLFGVGVPIPGYYLGLYMFPISNEHFWDGMSITGRHCMAPIFGIIAIAGALFVLWVLYMILVCTWNYILNGEWRL